MIPGLQDRGVEIDVVGEGDLCDAVHTVGGVGADGSRGVGLVRATACATTAAAASRSACLRTVPITVAPPQRASCAALR